MNASNVRKDKYTQKYQVMLREHLTQGPRANLRAAQRLGREAVAMGLETLEVAMIHEGAFG